MKGAFNPAAGVLPFPRQFSDAQESAGHREMGPLGGFTHVLSQEHPHLGALLTPGAQMPWSQLLPGAASHSDQQVQCLSNSYRCPGVVGHARGSSHNGVGLSSALKPPGAGQDTQTALSDTTLSRARIRMSGMWSVSILGPMRILLNSDSGAHLAVY